MVYSRATVYRRCDPLVVKNIWDILEKARAQKQSLAVSKLARAVCKACSITEDQASQRLKEAEMDGLIIKISSRGGDSYQLPDFTRPCPRLGHDWYCFECHSPGETIPCSDCFRVYHKSCIRDRRGKASPSTAALSHPEDDDDEFVCHVCQARPKCEFSRKQIRKLLEFATHHLRKQDNWRTLNRLWTNPEELCKLDYLVYHYIDLELIFRKIKDGRYTCLEDLTLDAGLLVHTVCLCWGPYSPLADVGRVLLREMASEVKEVALCTDCYINAKAKVADWISKPCRPPHDVIWARQRDPSSPASSQYYWPAKVLLERDSGYEVRFFGGAHARALVRKVDTRSFSLGPDEVGVRRGGGFERAWNEWHKLKANMDIGYYTHSSGESDLPPTDDEYTDEFYMKPHRIQALNSAHQAKIAASGTGLPGTSSSSRRLSGGVALSTGSKSPDKRRNRKSKTSGGPGTNHRRDSSSLWSGSSSHCSPSPRGTRPSAFAPATPGGSRRSRKKSAASSTAGGMSMADRAWEAATLTPTGTLFNSTKGKRGSMSISDDYEGSESPGDLDEWGYSSPSTTAAAKKAKLSTAPVNKVAGRKSPRQPAKKRNASVIGNGGKAGPPVKREKRDLSSTDSSDADEDASDDEDYVDKKISSYRSSKRGSPRRAAPTPAAAALSSKSRGAPLKGLSPLVSSDDSGEATDYCCQEEDDLPPRAQGTGLPPYTNSYTAANNHYAALTALGGFGAAAAALRAVSPKKMLDKTVQISLSPLKPAPVACNCREKFDRQLEESLQRERADSDRRVQEALDRLRRDLEAEKKAAVQQVETQAAEQIRQAAEQEKVAAREQVRQAIDMEQTKTEEILANAKKRQWCRNCLREAIYHCCWNTSYCSIQCQQEHWQKEHKRVCRRKR